MEDAMSRVVLLLSGCVFLLSACASPPKEPERFGVVETVKVEEKVDAKTGQVEIVKTIVEEKAERSVVDKGSDSLMAPQRVANFAQFFSYYDIGSDYSILASVYNQDSENGSDLWIYRTGKMRLTNTNYDHSSPSYSADNRYVYFVSYKGKKSLGQSNQDSYIWKTSATGNGGITRIGSPAFSYAYPSESPNGEMILYSSVELYGNSSYVWYMGKNGSLPTQLKQGEEPQWITNEKIIFTAKDESTGLDTIWSCNIDGSMMTQIIADDKSNCLSPSISFDGKYIAYVKETSEVENLSKDDPAYTDKIQETRDVYIFKVEDGLSQQVTTNESRDDLPKWSQDGKYLYFRSSRGLGWNVWRLDTSFLSQ